MVRSLVMLKPNTIITLVDISNQRGAVHFLIDVSNFHLVGHSLGAHVMGYAGKYFNLEIFY